MEIRQKRLSHRTRYVFGDERLDYEWQDPSGSRSFSVGYAEIGRDRQTLVERNAWLRNAGLFWVALGLFPGVFRYVDQHSLVPSVWLPVGIGCLIAYRLRTLHFTVVPTEKGNLMVIGDDNRVQILGQMDKRRSDALRREYDFFPGEFPPRKRGPGTIAPALPLAAPGGRAGRRRTGPAAAQYRRTRHCRASGQSLPVLAVAGTVVTGGQMRAAGCPASAGRGWCAGCAAPARWHTACAGCDRAGGQCGSRSDARPAGARRP